jgi:c-di-GMP-binding flagellar brake protein YcgR
MADKEKEESERRRFPRLSSPVYYRIAKSQSLRQRVSNISLGGVRIYSDHRLDVDEEVELELYFPGGFAGKSKARVVWIKELPPASGANYDVGLEFIHLPEEAIKKILYALKHKR